MYEYVTAVRQILGSLHPTFDLCVFLVPPSVFLLDHLYVSMVSWCPLFLYASLYVSISLSSSLSLWLSLCMRLGHVFLTYKQTLVPESSLVEMCHDAEVRSPSWI